MEIINGPESIAPIDPSNSMDKNAFNSYIFPSDSQLISKAKSGEGWSSKASRPGPKHGLSTKEEEAILNVIRRNEELTLKDSERVEALLSRYERIKSSYQPDRVSAVADLSLCSLCKKSSSTQIQCRNCFILICEKCSVRKTASRTTLGSSSSALAKDTSPISLSPDNSNQISLQNNVNTSVSWWTFKNPGFGLSSTHLLPSSQRRFSLKNYLIRGQTEEEPDEFHQSFIICHVCNEEREVWKKTGAWFYNSLPRKMNPSCPSSPMPSRSFIKDQKASSTDSYKRTTASSPHRQPSFNEDGDWKRVTNKEKPSELTLKSSDEPQGRIPNHSRALQLTPVTKPENRKPGIIKNNQTSEFIPTRKTSLSKPIPLPPSITQMKAIKPKDELIAEKSPEDLLDIPNAPFGAIHFSLQADPHQNAIIIKIHRAKNLMAMDSNGLSDPYVVVMVKPFFKFRTETIPQNLNPVWNESFQIPISDIYDKSEKLLRLAVLDEDMFGSDWLGEYQMTLEDIPYGEITHFHVPLAPRKFQLSRNDEIEPSNRGRIHLALQYMEASRQLRVDILRCAELAPMDPNGLSDPFVKIYLMPDKYRKSKQKTMVKRATLFPEYNETFYYDLNISEALQRTLEITVWDFDRGPTNDFIGGLNLGAGAKAERREVWLAVFRPPYRRFEAWFQLSSWPGHSYPQRASPKNPYSANLNNLNSNNNYDPLASEDILLIHQGGITPGIKN